MKQNCFDLLLITFSLFLGPRYFLLILLLRIALRVKEPSSINFFGLIKAGGNFFLFFLGFLSNVFLIEQDSKENKIRSIHRKTKFPIGRIHGTWNSLSLYGNHIDNKSHSSNHLDELNCGNERRKHEDKLIAGNCKSIISIHNGMNSIIDHCKVNSNRDSVVKRMPAIQKDSHMMKPMQEDNFFFADNQKDSINEFEKFRVNKNHQRCPNRAIDKPVLFAA
mmetsp:Transcript_3953/g.5153  ORF Transcript_3953/g.5153 Transcript_3953/m.5153 type:complete len:221 (+) Transcript_3953:67-729(+)